MRKVIITFGLIITCIFLQRCTTVKDAFIVEGATPNKFIENNITKEKEYKSPLDAKLKNVQELAYEEGRINGLKVGKEEGYDKGYLAGKKDGEKSAYKTVTAEYESTIAAYENSRSCAELAQEARLSGIELGMAKGYKIGFENGYVEGKRDGHRIGREIGYREGFQEQINLLMGKRNDVHLQPANFRTTLDYENAVEQLSGMNGNVEHDTKIYGELLHQIHADILKYVGDRLDLNNVEKRDLMKEYNHIHDELTQLYYGQFQDIYKARNIAAENSYEYFTDYHATDVFIDVATAGICGIVDVALAFATLNPLAGAAVGIATGFLCEMLVTNVLEGISDDMLKVAIFREYNKLVLDLKAQSVGMIAELAVTKFTNVHHGRKKKAVQFMVIFVSDAEVEMDITTELTLGFELSTFDIEIDHIKEQFIIHLPNAPKVLGTNQTVEFIKIDTGFFVEITAADLNEIYTKAKKETIENAMKQDIDEIAKRRAEQVLKALFQPIISIPHSNYKVIVKFGEKEEYDLFKGVSKD
jgi:flagellar biosynthesis/type III secretory pathway protein FliH